MLTYLKGLLLLPIVVAIVLLAIANRAPVMVSLDLAGKADPELSASVPLYGLVLAAIAVGVVLGGVGAWIASGQQRRSGRTSKREAQRLRSETESLRSSLATGNRALARPGSAG